MIPFEGFSLKSDRAESDKDDQCNNLLYHFQLYQIERAAILTESHPVGRNLKTIFKESNPPAKQDNTDQWQTLKPTELLFHLQMTVPCQRHKDIRYD